MDAKHPMPGAMGRLAATGATLFKRPDPVAPVAPVDSTPKADKVKSEKLSHEPKSVKPKGEYLANVSVDKISPWDFADRPTEEFGDISELALSIAMNGQAVPALVRPLSGGKFELIYGRRRWMACREARKDLWVIVKDLTDAQAFVEQCNENLDREDLSAWARSISYQAALDKKLFPSVSALASSLGLDKTTVSNIMVFQRLPKTLLDGVGDWGKVGITAAKAILTEWMANPKFEAVLIENKEALIEGRLGPAGIRALALTKVGAAVRVSEQVKTSAGLPVFSMSTNAKGEINISILSGGKSKLDYETLKGKLAALFE